MFYCRSYITFDILRRVISDYFNYDVFYVMNITDVDDKIIRRARRAHLFNNYTPSSLESLRAHLTQALALYRDRADTETDPDKKTLLSSTLVSQLMHTALTYIHAQEAATACLTEDDEVSVQPLPSIDYTITTGQDTDNSQGPVIRLARHSGTPLTHTHSSHTHTPHSMGRR